MKIIPILQTSKQKLGKTTEHAPGLGVKPSQKLNQPDQIYQRSEFSWLTFLIRGFLELKQMSSLQQEVTSPFHVDPALLESSSP